MDLGSELIKDIRGLVASYKCISAIEKSTCTVNSGLFLSCKKHDSLAGEVLSKYDALEYVDSDDFRSKHTVNEMFTQLLMEKGFQKRMRSSPLENGRYCPPIASTRFTV